MKHCIVCGKDDHIIDSRFEQIAGSDFLVCKHHTYGVIRKFVDDLLTANAEKMSAELKRHTIIFDTDNTGNVGRYRWHINDFEISTVKRYVTVCITSEQYEDDWSGWSKELKINEGETQKDAILRMLTDWVNDGYDWRYTESGE